MIKLRIICLLVCFIVYLPFEINGQSDSSTSSTAQVIATEEIYFDFGKHQLKTDDHSKLDAILELLKTNEFVIVKITAHTDAIGSDNSNQALSSRRGKAVKSFLISKGVPDSLMQVSVYGAFLPAAENDTENGRQLNRRATVEVIQQSPIASIPVKEKRLMGLVEGTVVDKTTGVPIQAKVVIRSKSVTESVNTDEKGYFSKEVPVNTVIGVDVYAPGYFFETQMMKVGTVAKLPILEFELPPAGIGAIAQVKDLFFVGNQAILLKKSKSTLPKVLIFMEINNKINIEIGGHVNHPNGKPGKFEQELSNNRAKLIYNFLIEHGIHEDRIIWKGYSSRQMKFPFPKNEKQSSQNRRVEIKVVE